MKKINKENTRDVAGKLLPEGLFAVIIAIAIVVNVILFIVTEAFGLYLYKPAVDDLTLSGNTDRLFSSAIADGKRVKITFCQDEDSVAAHSTGNYVYRTANYFAQKYPDFIEIEYVNILTRRNSKGELVSLTKYKTDMRGYPQSIFKSTVIFECGENYRVVTDVVTGTGYADFFTLDSTGTVTSYNGEEVMAGMISWVLNDEHRTAYFTQYHGEVVDIALANLLVSAGYYVDVIDLKKNEVPEDAGIVIVSNPTSDFEKAYEGSKVRAELDRLATYIEGGGNLLVSLDPYVKSLPTFEHFLAEYGIAMSYSTSEQGAPLRNMVKDIRNAITTDGFTLVTEYADDPLADSISSKVSTYTDGRVVIREACALELSEDKGARPLLITSATSTIEAGGKKIEASGGYCVGAYNDAGEGSVFVVPSVYLAVSDALVTNGYSNKEFVFALIEELYDHEGAPYGCKSVGYNTSILENLTIGTAISYTVFFMSIPVLIAIVGFVIAIRRKNM